MKSERQRHLYLRALLALSGGPPTGLTLRDCARALGAYDSSARQALARLADDGLASLAESRYVLTPTRRSALELERAQFELATEEIVRTVCRASPGVELGAFDPSRRTLYLVLDPGADASALVRLREALGRVPDLILRQYSSAELSGTTIEDEDRRRALRIEIARAHVLKGEIERALPLGARRRRPPRPLGHLHPSVREPSRRQKQRLARMYGLDELSVFGSATRSDLRPDSDVDAIVHFRAGTVPTLGSYAALARDLGELFDRRVDVIDASSVDHAFIPNIERDRVALYGRPHALVPREGAALRPTGGRRAGALGRRLERRSGRPRPGSPISSRPSLSISGTFPRMRAPPIPRSRGRRSRACGRSPRMPTTRSTSAS